tara:strand:- start:2843 stop:3205 length:363 start_codon:yes stop_codon:yes gene_type:complete
MQEWFGMFAADARVRTIGALILLDVMLGIANAIRHKEFDLEYITDFYFSMVLPGIIGYGALYFLIPQLVGGLLGEYSESLSQALVTLAWVALVGHLGKSAIQNVKKLYGKLPSPESDDMI